MSVLAVTGCFSACRRILKLEMGTGRKTSPNEIWCPSANDATFWIMPWVLPNVSCVQQYQSVLAYVWTIFVSYFSFAVHSAITWAQSQKAISFSSTFGPIQSISWAWQRKHITSCVSQGLPHHIQDVCGLHRSPITHREQSRLGKLSHLQHDPLVNVEEFLEASGHRGCYPNI